MANIESKIRQIEERAANLHSIIDLAPRAFVVEFAGTPKSGKSTSVEAIRHFFRRHGFGVHVLTERAAQCPIPMKGHLFFNTWCASTMLAELLENVETKTDIIIADRGLFDSLIWFQLQNRRGELSDDELQSIENFLLMDRWTNLFDLVAVLEASAKIALQRESAKRISAKTGSIMNTSVLESLSDAVRHSQKEYSGRFKKIVVSNTDSGDERTGCTDLASKILDSFEEFVNPKILVVSKLAIEKILARSPSGFGESETTEIRDVLEQNAQFVRRAEAEENDEFIQVVSCGALVHSGKIFVFQRHDKNPKSRLYGKSTIWQGCHVNQVVGDAPIFASILSALESRIAESLFISRKVNSQFVGYAWDDSSKQARRHLGIIHRVDIESIDLAENLKKKEYRRSRGYNLAGGFSDTEELISRMDDIDLEPWSRVTLKNRARALK